MFIDNIKLDNKFILAPMAGVTDKAFRYVCKEYGAGMTVSEMISSKALTFNDKKTLRLMEKNNIENPYVVQTFSSEPLIIKEAIPMIENYSKCDIIDINMGCPAPKITSNGEGSALMKDIKLAEELIKSAVSVAKVPITVKFRKGYTQSTQNYLEFAKMAESAGAKAITLHGRTRDQMYSGSADWDAILQVKQAVKIPVIANGDVTCGQKAKEILDYTGADFVMIGRGAFGNPFIFDECNKICSNLAYEPPSLKEKLEVFAKQMKFSAEFKSEKIAMLEARKHFVWYLKGVSNTRAYKELITKITTIEQMQEIIKKLLEEEERYE